WNSWIPRKVNVLVWKASLDRLAMRPNLTARGVDIPSLTCLFCESDFEDIGHVLVKCLKVSAVWRKVWSWWNLPPPTSFPSFSSIDVVKGNFLDRGCPSIEKVMNGDFPRSWLPEY
ncbi:RNA-directed DNA polymerase, eukaryota, reverse transcriptase zinc-binding domain protein, partial [Tanacetum coccineum]